MWNDWYLTLEITYRCVVDLLLCRTIHLILFMHYRVVEHCHITQHRIFILNNFCTKCFWFELNKYVIFQKNIPYNKNTTAGMAIKWHQKHTAITTEIIPLSNKTVIDIHIFFIAFLYFNISFCNFTSDNITWITKQLFCLERLIQNISNNFQALETSWNTKMQNEVQNVNVWKNVKCVLPFWFQKHKFMP